MTANERRAEIIRILAGRRRETMRQLACELGVTSRTIYNDIIALTVDHPIETIRGNGGCVKLADWYHPSKIILNQNQQAVLIQLMGRADEHEQMVLREILTTYGSPNIKEHLSL